MWEPNRSWDRTWVAALVVVSAGLCWPLVSVDWFHSDEGDAYVMRTVELASELSRGCLYPRWAPNLYGGHGSPFFVFYAPLVYLLSGAFSLWIDVLLALKLVAFVATLAAGVGTYALVRGETGRDDAALLGATLYLAAPYRLTNLYGRGDLAEFLAIGLFPGVLALYRAAGRARTVEAMSWLAAGAAAIHAAMILSHTILGLWGTGIAALGLITSSLELARRRAARRAAALAVAWVSAIGLSLVYTGPALLEKPEVRIEAMTVGFYDFRNRWLPLSALLEPGRFDARVVLCLSFVLSALAVVLRGRRALPALASTLAGALLAALCLPVGLPLWKSGLVPFARFVQFPCRLLGPAALLAAVGAGVAFAVLARRHGALRPLAVVLSGGALLMALPALQISPMSRALVRDTPDAVRASVSSTTGVDEYLPKGVPAAPRAPAASVVKSTTDTTVRSATSDGTRHELSLVATAPGSIDLALHDYPGWTVTTLEGPAKVTHESSAAGLLTLRLPVAGEYRLSVDFTDPPSRRAFSWVSVLVAALLLPLLRWTLGLGQGASLRLWWPRLRRQRRFAEGAG